MMLMQLSLQDHIGNSHDVRNLLTPPPSPLPPPIVVPKAVTTPPPTQKVDEEIPRRLNQFEEMIQTWKKRVHFLETSLFSYLGFNSDPFFWTKEIAPCNNKTGLKEYCRDGPGCSWMDAMYVCLDDFPYNDCIVYDFGIRTQPHFGVILSKPPFNCQVYAFDPSPITKNWYINNTELKSNPNYHLYHYGGGGADENITLREYNWDQISIYSYPTKVIMDPRNCTQGACRSRHFPAQKLIHVPVRSVSSIMTELKHKRVDVLKLDVEGSEYRMLEGILSSDMACQNINQITLEWHHYQYDGRYGASSAPILNMYHKLLQDQCHMEQFWLHDVTGWPSNSELYLDMKLTLMYNIASFKRVKESTNS
jgi:FkbM family methyltransferase